MFQFHVWRGIRASLFLRSTLQPPGWRGEGGYVQAAFSICLQLMIYFKCIFKLIYINIIDLGKS